MTVSDSLQTNCCMNREPLLKFCSYSKGCKVYSSLQYEYSRLSLYLMYCTATVVCNSYFSFIQSLCLAGSKHCLNCLIFSELFYDRGNHHEFTSLVRDLARPGELMQSATYDFEFVNVEKPYETYTGANVRLR